MATTRNFSVEKTSSRETFCAALGSRRQVLVGCAGGLLFWLAWAYVASRVVHAIVHLGGNRIPSRMAVYGASWLVLLAMWATLVAGVATSTT